MKRNTAVFYTNATCNLNCRYCSIDKNPALQTIDKILEKSFGNPDYYFNQVIKFFPELDSLTNIEFWGGEPTLHFERVIPLINKIIEYYPNFYHIYHSTNMVANDWYKKILLLINNLENYSYRNFQYDLQLSCDGPEEINDAGRGIGTTKRSLDSYHNLLNYFKKNPLKDNIKLTFCLKPTLDLKTLKTLDTKEKIINYYQYFENEWLYPAKSLNLSNIQILCPIPNIATPMPATTEDGLFFNNFLKNCKELMQENIYSKYFKYYSEIRPLSDFLYYDINGENENTLNSNGCLCGSGTTVIGFLPYNKISICHEGFTSLIDDYKKYASNSKRIDKGTIEFDNFIQEQKNKYCLTEEQYKEYEYQINKYYQNDSKARLTNITSSILVLAMCGQIDKRYLSQREALKAARMIFNHTAYCLKSNYNVTGSITLVPFGEIRLLCNGALDYLE